MILAVKQLSELTEGGQANRRQDLFIASPFITNVGSELEALGIVSPTTPGISS